MTSRSRFAATMLRLAGSLLLSVAAGSSHAVPSFARQTGMECTGCHIGAFGPQLTPAGIQFKLTGYVDTDGKTGKIPLSAMAVGSWTRTRSDQEPPSEHLDSNDNVKLDEASIFLAGRLAANLGTFIQLTHNGIDHSNSLDQTDIRLADTVRLGGHDVVLGLSLNNNPGVQDPFNTLTVWGYPYVSSEAAYGTGDAATLLNGGLEGRVAGLNGYLQWNKTLYAELGSYRSLSPSAQSRIGLGRDPQRLGGNVYWRAAWMTDMNSQAMHVGVFGWNARLAPDRADPDVRDRYNDVGVDGTYEFLGTRRHIVTVNGSYIAEHRTDGANGDKSRLFESRLNASYHFKQTWGASAGWFSTHGADADTRTSGVLTQADWTPWGKEDEAAPDPFSLINLRLGLQLWHYDHFGGDSASARSHDTAFLFAWLAF